METNGNTEIPKPPPKKPREKPAPPKTEAGRKREFDEVDEASKDSFPASDPPSWWS